MPLHPYHRLELGECFLGQEFIIFQLKFTLKGIRPPVWRRVLVSEDMNLLQLHDLIQAVFGWWDYHLHLFKIAGMEFVNTSDWEEDGDQYQDDSRAKLGDLIPRFVPEGGMFIYTYDMGDYWEHEILVEKILPDSEKQKTPMLLAGRRSCPPEDVGGPWGYENFLEAIQDPEHPEHETFLEWIGVDFDPEAFDLEADSRSLASRMRQAHLERNTSWPSGPFYANFESVVRSDWTRSIQSEDQAAARELPLRRDMVTLLTYLLEHNVKGTDATGNFPLKHVRDISAGFVDPPELDQEIGDRVYKLRTEDEVPSLKRLHLLACVGGLIHGGENMHWVLLEQGEVFLSLPPEEQVWYLVKIWFRKYNWLYEYNTEIQADLDALVKVVVDTLSGYPSKTDISMTELVSDIGARLLMDFGGNDIENERDRRRWFLEKVVVNPLADFGFLERVEDVKFIESYEFTKLKAVRLTSLGQGLLPYLNFRRWRSKS